MVEKCGKKNVKRQGDTKEQTAITILTIVSRTNRMKITISRPPKKRQFQKGKPSYLNQMTKASSQS